ncbi:MAG: DUF177 domain-containing protein [Vallitaleaceae bacterium]|nr:DUF177 domain-containing protein [Vallitaleaceae bacterium]
MQINLTDILSNDLDFEKIEKTIMMDSIQFNKETIKVQDGVNLKLELRKISSNEILLEGSLNTNLVLNCDRCNAEVKYPLGADFSKEVRVDQLTKDNEDDFIEGYNLDLEKLAQNEIYLNFPMKILCKEDCKSICTTCGTNLNLQSCDCESDDIDPRLAGLKDLFNENFKEV